MSVPAESDVPTWARYWPATAGTLAIVFGGALLLAASRGAPLVALLQGLEPPPRVAAAQAGLGAALVLAALRPRGALRHARWPLELGALLLGALGLLEHSLGHALGRSGLLAAADGNLPASLLASAAVVLCALALLAEHLGGSRGRGLSRSLATLAGLVALVALVGHLFGAPPLYRPLPLDVPFTVLGACAMIVLGSGIVALRAQHGWPSVVLAPTLTGLQMRWSLLAAVLVPLLMGGIALRIHEVYPFGPVAIALMAAGTTLLLGAIVGAAANWLRRSEDRLERSDRALAAIPQGVFIVDGLRPGRPNLYVNPAYAALTGHDVEEAVGESFDAVSIFADSTWPDTATSLDHGGSHRVVLRRRNGTVFPAKVTLSAVPRDDGDRYVIGLIEDVTAEELAAKQRLELLAEAAQARKDAEAANRAKDTFFASLSHELRSPLNACVMWLDVLALGPPPDKVVKGVEAIRRNLGRQTRLVNDLIDAAKISSGGIEVHLEPLDLVALLKRNLETWQMLAVGKQLAFADRIEPQSANVDADSDRLLQVLNNLIENAVENTTSGGRVALTLRESDDAYLLEIEDTGVGLAPEEVENLFTPFWRSPASTRSHKGLGLGLAIAHHLVSKHGGSLSAASAGPGTGATFTVSLPRNAERSAHRHSHASASTAS